MRDVIVIGAGSSGIATAVALKERGVEPLVLDRAKTVASSWHGRYDRLRLNTGRQFSHLPGRRYPKGTPTYPTREEVVAHIHQHALEAGIELALGVGARRLDPDGRAWIITTDDGDLRARHVVVAAGYDHTPFTPHWPGLETFSGERVHSAHYRNADPYRGKRVVVVGARSSGMEIAFDLVQGGADKVWLSVRTPPNIFLRKGPAGLPGDVIAVPLQHLPTGLADRIARFGRKMAIGDLSAYGLPVPDEGPFAISARLGVAPAIVDPEVITAIKTGTIDIVAAVASFDTTGPVLADGTTLDADAVICSTGFERALEPLVGHLGVLRPNGTPLVHTGEAAPGLRFIGYIARAAQLGYAARMGKTAAKEIARDIRSAQ